jgi:hypothetical protein
MIAQQMKLGIIIKDRKYNFRVHKQCFLGRDAVDWLVTNTNATNREEALILGRKMVSKYAAIQETHHLCELRWATKASVCG